VRFFLIFLVGIIITSLVGISNFDYAFADENTIISVNIIGDPVIYLDSENKMIRAKVVIENFDPSDGYYFMRVSDSSGNVVKETEILPKNKGNQIWGTEIAHIFTNEVPETFQILIYTEFGTATATATVSLLETKPNVQQSVKEEADEPEPIVELEQTVPVPTVTEEIKKGTSVFEEPITSADDFDRRSAECETYECQQAQMYAKLQYQKQSGQYESPMDKSVRETNERLKQEKLEAERQQSEELYQKFIEFSPFLGIAIAGFIGGIVVNKKRLKAKEIAKAMGKYDTKKKEDEVPSFTKEKKIETSKPEKNLDEIQELRKKVKDLEEKVEKKDTSDSWKQEHYKSLGITAVVAFLGGFILFGLGHFYVGKKRSGIGWLIIGIILSIVSVGAYSLGGYIAGFVFGGLYLAFNIIQTLNAVDYSKQWNMAVSQGIIPW